MGDIYLPLPVDRKQMQEKKLAKLQQEIAEMEHRIQENVTLRQHLESISNAENERTQRVLDRLSSRNMLLKDEIERLYGHSKDPQASPSTAHLVNEVISQRTKEFSQLQQEKAMQIKYLMIEKQRLQEAQERLRLKRQMVMRQPTPVDGKDVSRCPSLSSVHSASSLVKRAVNAMPQTVDRIKYLRATLQHDYERRKKPYKGELGANSYKPWQMEDYVLVHSLVEEIIDDFIAQYIPSTYGHGERDLIQAAYLLEDKDWVMTVQALEENKTLQLIAEEIMLQETRAVMRRAAAEVLHVHGTFKNMTDVLFIAEAEKISTGQSAGRDQDDPAYSLITKHYFKQQQSRNIHKKDVWAHSQYLHTTSQLSGQENDEKVDADTELITFFHLHPSDLKKFEKGPLDPPEVCRKMERAAIYKRREAQFWKGMIPVVSKLTLPSRCRGVQCVKPSPDHTLIAIGTVHGDIIVYDVCHEPWKTTRVVHNTASVDDSTVDLAWSLDATRLISVNQGGSMQVWGFAGTEADRNTISALALQADEHGNIPLVMQLLGSLDVDQDDFTFHIGPLKELGLLKASNLPTKGVFFPSLSIFGIQHSVCIGLDSGDLLKVNVEPFSSSSDANAHGEISNTPHIFYQPNIYDVGHGVNLIGQNLEAELFRHHVSTLIFLGFINNINQMVTVDMNGFINIWRYDLSRATEFGYFVPEKKYKLDLNKTMYKPSSSEKSKVIFSDTNMPGRSQAEIASERKTVQSALDRMQLGDPWHEEIIPNKNLKSCIYAPKGGVKDTGAVFNIIVRHMKTNQISAYHTQMYKPVKVRITKLLSVCQTPSGRELVFVLLFPEFPPKEPHITVLVLDLSTMQLRDLRCDIHLNATDYASLLQDDIFSCDTTRVLGATGAEYLFFIFSGLVKCISLTTGNLVLRAENPLKPSGFIGSTIDERQLKLSKMARVSSISCNGHIYALLHDKSSTTMNVVQLQDSNEEEVCQLMWKAYQLSGHYRQVPPELRVDRVTWMLSDMQYADVEMRRLLLDLVDEKIFKVQPGLDKQADAAQNLKDKTEQYTVMQAKVDKMALLDL